MSEILSHIQRLLALQLDAARYGIASMSQAQFADYCSWNSEIDALLGALSPQKEEVCTVDVTLERNSKLLCNVLVGTREN